jgi:hypothetical protein
MAQSLETGTLFDDALWKFSQDRVGKSGIVVREKCDENSGVSHQPSGKVSRCQLEHEYMTSPNRLLRCPIM